MRPLKELLDRIARDPEFRKGTFAIGYYDRVARQERIVPLESVTRDPRRPEMLSVSDPDGIILHIPLHRVRAVYKDGADIWRRPDRSR